MLAFIIVKNVSLKMGSCTKIDYNIIPKYFSLFLLNRLQTEGINVEKLRKLKNE